MGSITVQSIAELRGVLRGRLLLPDAKDFQQARQVFNRRIENRPTLIAYCEGVADVVHGIKYAADHGLKVGVRCGGHSASGFSVPNGGMLLDVSPMKGVLIDQVKMEATAQSGLRWHEFNNELAALGYATPGGGCPMVGLTGFTLGGGYGYLSRKYGLGADNVRRVTLVTYEGKEIVADNNTNSDLFWALRGGGGGNFGVVTSITYAIYKVGTVYGGTIIWDWSEAKQGLMAFFKFFANPSSPREACFFGTCATDPLSLQKVFLLSGLYIGTKEQGTKALDPLLKAGHPIVALEESTYHQFCQGGPEGPTMIQYAQQSLWRTGYLVPGIENDGEFADKAITWFNKAPSVYSMVNIDLGGGAIFDKKDTDTAFVHRDKGSIFSWDIIGVWDKDNESDANYAWANAFHADVKKWKTGRVYQNYADAELKDWAEAYYGKNYGPLQKAKKRYDPYEMFSSFPQAIQLPAKKEKTEKTESKDKSAKEANQLVFVPRKFHGFRL